MEQSALPICKLEIFIPESHIEALQEALQSVDAGHIGKYDCCMSYSPVRGRWRPLMGAQPYDGDVGVIQEAEEYKVEVCCQIARLGVTLAAIKAAHPYEEPVINVIPLLATGLS